MNVNLNQKYLLLRVVRVVKYLYLIFPNKQ
nr:MAG TPA: hypothetical protein [Bacteriophage sp.]